MASLLVNKDHSAALFRRRAVKTQLMIYTDRVSAPEVRLAVCLFPLQLSKSNRMNCDLDLLDVYGTRPYM